MSDRFVHVNPRLVIEERHRQAMSCLIEMVEDAVQVNFTQVPADGGTTKISIVMGKLHGISYVNTDRDLSVLVLEAYRAYRRQKGL